METHEVGKKKRKDQKYILDDYGRRLFLEIYDGEPETLDKLQSYFPTVPRHILSKWGCQLIPPPQRHGRQRQVWSPDECAFIERHYPQMDIAKIAAKLKRSEAAIMSYAYKHGLSKNDDGYTLASLCSGLGCSKKTLQDLIQRGELRGKRQRENNDHSAWLFSTTEVQRCIRRNFHLFSPRRIDWHWYNDVCFGGDKGIGELSNKVTLDQQSLPEKKEPA
jgi:hypothetical protein